jgi:hypothetical protein
VADLITLVGKDSPDAEHLRTELRLVLPLRRLHSGRLGDNVAWLATGIAALLAAFTALK